MLLCSTQTYRRTPSTLGSCHTVVHRNNASHNDTVQTAAELQPSLALQVQYSMKILYVPVRIRQNRSSPSIPGSPTYAQLRK